MAEKEKRSPIQLAAELVIIQARLDALRAEIVDPVLLTYGSVKIEIAPIGYHADDRVNISKTGKGYTCVNYTSDGVIVDVYNENVDLVETMSIQNEDLNLDGSSA